MISGQIRKLSRHKRAANPGFTLVELLIALIIISTVFLAFCDLMVMSVRTNKKADNEFVATVAAEGKLEGIRQSSFSSLVTGTTTETVATLPGGQMTTQISSVSGYITNSMLQVQIVVTWDTTGGQETTGGSVRLDTILAQSR